jgi:hypothetical protein
MNAEVKTMRPPLEVISHMYRDVRYVEVHDPKRMNMRSLCLLRSCSMSSLFGVAWFTSKEPRGVSVSTAVKFGDMGTGWRFGDVLAVAVRDGKFGGVDVVEAKFEAYVDTGVTFDDLEVANVDGMKFGDVAAGDADMRYGGMGAGVAVTAGKFGDIDFVGMRGRKFGDMAKESVRLGAETEEVANRAGKFGDVEVRTDADVCCADVLGQIASVSSSTGS